VTGIDRPDVRYAIFAVMLPTRDEIFAVLRHCYDPEIPLNVVDLGLIYGLEIQPHPEKPTHAHVIVKMTLTSSGCPMANSITSDLHQRLLAVPSVASAHVALVWEPQWRPDLISAEGRAQLKLP
jgi:metal-sulfur cluster biosynthetic enzyme